MPGPGPGSGLTLAQLRSRVKDQATFAETNATIDEWLNEKHKQLVVKSKWDQRIVEIALTIANTAEYDLDPNIVEIDEITVADAPYDAATGGIRSIWQLRKGNMRVAGPAGVFAQNFKSDGTPQLSLYPTPATAGDSIEALATFTPADLSGDGSYPIVPEDVHEAIADGAIALGWRIRAENAPEAEVFEQRFQTAIEEVRRRKNRRVGGGVVQIAVQGYHF